MVYFIIFIRVFSNLVWLFKYFSNAFQIFDINKKRKSYKGIILLNIKLINTWIINNLYYNYLILDINIKTIKDKKKVIYNKYLFITTKNVIINNKNKKIDIE